MWLSNIGFPLTFAESRGRAPYPISKYLKAMNKMNKPLDKTALFSYLDKHISIVTQREGFRWKVFISLAFLVLNWWLKKSWLTYLLSSHPSFKNLVDTHMGTQVSGLSSTSFFYISAHGCPLATLKPRAIYSVCSTHTWELGGMR